MGLPWRGLSEDKLNDSFRPIGDSEESKGGFQQVPLANSLDAAITSCGSNDNVGTSCVEAS
jgi:hypothetical protein